MTARRAHAHTMRNRLHTTGRIAGGALLALGTLLLPATTAHATSPDTLPGLHTVGCAVDWRTQSDLSLSLTKDYNNDGTITNDEVYSNRGYLYEVSSDNTYPAVHGPGDLLIHHWADNASDLGFRLPLATDYTMYDVTVTITADSPNFTLASGLTPLGLDKYVAIDGNPKYTIAAPAPTVTHVGGALVLHWDTLPAGSANIYGFDGTTTGSNAQDPANHYLVGATLTATYAEGAGCTPTVPPFPGLPDVGKCEVALAGRTLLPVDATDVTTRDKYGKHGEVNADAWGAGATRTFRLYGTSDRDLKDVTYTAHAAQGFTFDPASVGAVLTATPVGMGTLYADGYTVAATGIGTPVVSADGRTVTLTIASMPAHSGIAFTITAVLDGSLKQLVVDETLVATKSGCKKPHHSDSPGAPTIQGSTASTA